MDQFLNFQFNFYSIRINKSNFTLKPATVFLLLVFILCFLIFTFVLSIPPLYSNASTSNLPPHNTTFHLFQYCYGSCTAESQCSTLQNALGAGLIPHLMNGVSIDAFVGKPKDYIAGRGKILALQYIFRTIQSLPHNDVVALSDTDIFWLGHNLSTEMVNIYQSKYNGKIVFSSETNCWNGLQLKELEAKSWLEKTFSIPVDYKPLSLSSAWFAHWLFCYHPLYQTPKTINTTHKFLNAGFLIGLAGTLRNVIEDFLAFDHLEASEFCSADQCVWQAFSINDSRIHIDFYSDFILSGHGHALGRDFQIKDDRLYHPETDSYPFGFHGNGKSKRMYESLMDKYSHKFDHVSEANDRFYADGIPRSFKETCIESGIIKKQPKVIYASEMISDR